MDNYFGRTLGTCIVGLGLLAFVISAPADERKPPVSPPDASADEPVERLSAEAALRRWPDLPKRVALRMIEKYGPPEEVGDESLVWRHNGPWARTVVSREPIEHDFPYRHEDVLQQWIDYKVPLGRFDDLARFDGSVIPDRTAGLLSARGDSEELNLLALNLADDVVRGRRSVDDARRYMAKSAMLAVSGKTSDYTAGFRFKISPSGNADADQTLTTGP